MLIFYVCFFGLLELFGLIIIESKVSAIDKNAVLKDELFGIGEFNFPSDSSLQNFNGNRNAFKIRWDPIDPVELRAPNSDGGKSINGIVSLKCAIVTVGNLDMREFRLMIAELNHAGQQKAKNINDANSSGNCCCAIL